MKGLYITEEGKKELEDKIAELEKSSEHGRFGETYQYDLPCIIYKEILSSAIVLPVEESWDFELYFPPDNESQVEWNLKYKNGVIIQPKS